MWRAIGTCGIGPVRDAGSGQMDSGKVEGKKERFGHDKCGTF